MRKELPATPSTPSDDAGGEGRGDLFNGGELEVERMEETTATARGGGLEGTLVLAFRERGEEFFGGERSENSGGRDKEAEEEEGEIIVFLAVAFAAALLLSHFARSADMASSWAVVMEGFSSERDGLSFGFLLMELCS